ncbi:nitrogenase component 1 [Loigolactobacillus bifermentans]|uniref:Nitrogenase/oxidoreductase component 1 domain-containing protein n=1 Tax=Loigolactobacillus bifermentans DSM 20003 TaxID=1423726 RepID=A0A0R1H0A7_9LACO|nr:nitrogenase component 1 [Loigolactobacillus bifermentans]KRK39839.1 hypothetical protein FC07_GL002241 [Loigolactobacillus bifermentans DSM 20003]QGG61497.1 nitrogenase [Loigolactobacillus bifermentans]
MLMNAHTNMKTADPKTCLPISQVSFPMPFDIGLEYSTPARGHWTIVHTGLALPEAHLIYVCPQGCLRGVVLSAAELGVSDRFSTIEVAEENVLQGDLEDQIIDGVNHIIDELPNTPPAIELFTSCIHQFLGLDLHMVFGTLRADHPEIQFTDCYMNPIMRKGKWNPNQKMRRQLYTLLKKTTERDDHAVNFVGDDFAIDHSSELYQLLAQNHYTVREVATCQTYADYQEMAKSVVAITRQSPAMAAGKLMKVRYGQEHLHLPYTYNYDEIEQNLQTLADALHLDYQPDLALRAQTDAALAHAYALIGDTPIYIDSSFSPRILGLARVLLAHGFNVTDLYVDGFDEYDQDDLKALQASTPELRVHPSVDPGMRMIDRSTDDKVLAIGQKAAYFTNSPYFVNIVQGAGFDGFDGLQKIAALMEDAYQTPKDVESVIQVKALGWGCNCL